MDSVEAGCSKHSQIVRQIQLGDPQGTEALYEEFAWVKGYFASRLGIQDADDRYHDLMIAVVSGIRHHGVRLPERLAGYVKAIVNNLIANSFRVSSIRRFEPLPPCDLLRTPATVEEHVYVEESRVLARAVLAGICHRDREVLIRFYLNEEAAPKIQSEMRLTATQFRLIKSRAKARFGKLLRRRIQPKRAVGPSLTQMTV
jgi:RNA polymerase sigma-70 factor (ECF subfamily)